MFTRVVAFVHLFPFSRALTWVYQDIVIPQHGLEHFFGGQILDTYRCYAGKPTTMQVSNGY